MLKLGAVAGASAISGGGCTGLLPSSLPGGERGPLDGFFSQLDDAMDAIAAGTPLHDLFDERATEQPDHAESGRQAPYGEDMRRLIQKSLRSLLLTGAYHDLPEAQRQHPEFQKRVLAAGPELDEAIFGMTHLLDGMSRGDRVELQRQLRKDPGLPERVAETLDKEAQEIGIPLKRRLRMRRLAKHVVWRMEKQPVDTLLDEYVGKVRKLAVRSGYDEAVQRQIATRATTRALLNWQPAVAMAQAPGAAPAPIGQPPAGQSPTVQSPPGQPAAGQPPTGQPPTGQPPTGQPAAAQPKDPGTAPPQYPYGPYPYGGPFPLPPREEPAQAPWAPDCVPKDEASRGQGAITAGSILLGVAGALSITGTTMLVSGTLNGFFVLTGAGLLLVAGLVTLIVGAVQAVNRPDGPTCPDSDE